MMDAKHTPGPWSIGGISTATGSISINQAEYRIVICDVTNAASFGEIVAASIRGEDANAQRVAKSQWANARLISAAPEMLAALKAIAADLMETGAPLTPPIGQQMFAAIGKAERAA